MSGRFPDLPLVIDDDPARLPPEIRHTWDGRVRRWALRTWKPDQFLPDAEPVYVKSFLYVFGVLTLTALVMLFVTGIPLAIMGPSWWLTNAFGGFMDSLHYWSVQLFFLFMFAHFIAVFLMGAFRGRRGLTWALGILAFGVAVLTGFTGYASIQDFEAQWITTQGKDAINSTGLGWFFNLLNTGQMITWHVVVLPLAVLGIVLIHVLAIRRRGIAPPYDALDAHLTAGEGPT
ncbi:MAG: cytochrome b N-terminal domain-containing protein [Chloroflexota bacterium]